MEIRNLPDADDEKPFPVLEVTGGGRPLPWSNGGTTQPQSTEEEPMEKDSSHVLGRVEALSAAVRSMLTSLPHAEDRARQVIEHAEALLLDNGPASEAAVDGFRRRRRKLEL